MDPHIATKNGMSSSVKEKKYIVEVRSHVSAEMIVFANSKDEAWAIADRDMAESLKRQIQMAPKNPFVRNVDGYSEAMKSTVRLVR